MVDSCIVKKLIVQKMKPILLNSNKVWIPNLEYFLDDTNISDSQPSEGMIIWQDIGELGHC